MKKMVRKLLNRLLNFINNSDIGKLNSKTREEWIIAQIKNIPENSIVLDAGAGLMPYKKYFEGVVYKSQDFGEYDGSGDESGLQKDEFDTSKIDIVSDITAIPLKKESVDVILCSEVFEHIVDPLKALDEFYRLLKSGGKLILTAPFNSITHFSPHFYSTGFSKNYYEYHLKDKGFRIIEIQANGNYFDYIAQEIQRLPKVSRQYSKVSSNFFLEICLRYILKYLDENSKGDTKSNELLCFGYNVLSEKI